MDDILTVLGLNLFELITTFVVGLIAFGIWIYNRKYSDNSSKIKIPTEVLVLFVMLAGIIVIVISRSNILNDSPLLLSINIFLLIVVVSSFINIYFTFQVKSTLKVVSERFGEQMAGIGNLQFFPTKEETFKELVKQTANTKEKLIATRFSPADVSIEGHYWDVIQEKAFDPKVLYIRIHSIAHASSSCIDGVCKLISTFRGAKNFRLGIALYNNSFEMIISDEDECIFCFHDLEMTVRNGFRVDTHLPSSAKVVNNFDSTLRNMLTKCYLVIDFEKYVKTSEDVENLQSHLRKIHEEYIDGKVPKAIHTRDIEKFMQREIFQTEN